MRQHTSAYVSIRQHTPAYVSIRQHTPAYVSIRPHTPAYLRAEVADEDALFAKKNAQPSGINPDYIAQHEVGMCRVRPQESAGASTSRHTLVTEGLIH